MNGLASLRVGITKIKPLLLWLIGAYLAYRLAINGVRKFDPEGIWTGAFASWGYPIWFRYLVGVMEVGGGLFMLIPRIRHIGALILFFVMVGALITRSIHGVGFDDVLTISFYAITLLYFATYESKAGDVGGTRYNS